MDRTAVASTIDHTLLAPEAVTADVDRLCDAGVELGVASVCVHSRYTAHAVDRLAGRLPVASVIGFPSGAHRSDVKAYEAGSAIADGASELDMVVALGAVLDGRWAAVAADVAEVRAVAPEGVLLKVIVESAVLDEPTLRRVCDVAVESGADFVKTSTGFHPRGGATLDAVRIMRDTVGPDVGVKASGGIRDAETALAMLEAGATRIGASSTAAILDGL